MSKPKEPVFWRNPFKWVFETGPGLFALLVCVLILMVGAPIVFGITDHENPWAIGIKCLQPVIIATILLWLKLGSPLNWWSPFFGIMMRVNVDKIASREQAGESSATIQSEIEQWVENCAKGRSVKINPYTFKFLRKGDAAFFKLAWG